MPLFVLAREREAALAHKVGLALQMLQDMDAPSLGHRPPGPYLPRFNRYAILLNKIHFDRRRLTFNPSVILFQRYWNPDPRVPILLFSSLHNISHIRNSLRLLDCLNKPSYHSSHLFLHPQRAAKTLTLSPISSASSIQRSRGYLSRGCVTSNCVWDSIRRGCRCASKPRPRRRYQG